MCSTLTRNEVEFLSYLLSIGADPGRTLDSVRYAYIFLPIEFCAFSSTESNARLLLRHGAIVDKTNAIQLAAQNGRLEMVRLLLEAGGNVNWIINPTDFSTPYYFGTRTYGTALHYAAAGGFPDVVEFLMEKGADSKILDSAGKTAVARARENNHEEIVWLIQSYK